MEILFLKGANGVLIPMDEDEEEKMNRFKIGDVIKVQVSAMRNGQFFRKWWSLAKMGFDMKVERTEPQEYKGIPIQHNFETFRKDLIVLAGYGEPVFRLDGSFKLEAKSISFAQMNEETFEKLYSETINVILKHIVPHMDERQIRRAVNQVLHYA